MYDSTTGEETFPAGNQYISCSHIFCFSISIFITHCLFHTPALYFHYAGNSTIFPVRFFFSSTSCLSSFHDITRQKCPIQSENKNRKLPQNWFYAWVSHFYGKAVLSNIWNEASDCDTCVASSRLYSYARKPLYSTHTSKKKFSSASPTMMSPNCACFLPGHTHKHKAWLVIFTILSMRPPPADMWETDNCVVMFREIHWGKTKSL